MGGSRTSRKWVHLGVRFADLISFFLNIPLKWNNLVSLRPNYFIFIGFLKTGVCVCVGGGGGSKQGTPWASTGFATVLKPAHDQWFCIHITLLHSALPSSTELCHSECNQNNRGVLIITFLSCSWEFSSWLSPGLQWDCSCLLSWTHLVLWGTLLLFSV